MGKTRLIGAENTSLKRGVTGTEESVNTNTVLAPFTLFIPIEIC